MFEDGEKVKRIVQMNVLAGEPTDGSGKVCIHLFVRDETGEFVEPHVLHPAAEPGKVIAKPTRGRLACDPKRNPATMMRGNVTIVTPHTDDPRAATCPKCQASPDYANLLSRCNQEK
jgi:hypothetical protein